MDKLGNQVFRFEGFTLDRRHRCLRAGDRYVELRPRSFDVLCYLVERAGRLVTKDELIEAVWPQVVVTDESLTRCISDVRRALGDSEQLIIKTLPRRGYLFAAEVESGWTDAPASPNSTGNIVAEGGGRRIRGMRRCWSGLAGFLAVVIALASSAWWLRPAPVSPSWAHPSVVVLPFVDPGSNAGQGAFGESVAEDLAVSLSKFGRFSVIPMGSAFPVSMIDARQTGANLGARYLVHGSIRRDPERLRLTVQLLDAANGWQLWAEHYDSAPDDTFAVQDELIRRIVIALAAHIDHAELEHALRRSPETLTAYDYYLRGNALLKMRPHETRGATLAATRALYEQALAADPRYAPALQALAETYLLAWLEPSPDHSIGREFQQPASLERARSLAEHAVELEPGLAKAHATLGWIRFWQHRVSEALEAFELAFRFNPNLIDGRYALVLLQVGREGASLVLHR